MSLRPALLMAAGAFFISTRALPHAILMDSTPRTDGVARAGNLSVTLRYNSLIDVKRSRLVLIGPDGREHRLAIAPTSQGDRMTATAAVQPGANLLRWQVLAVDGHITRGNVKFDATQPAPPVAGR